jgi:hypothetical protein
MTCVEESSPKASQFKFFKNKVTIRQNELSKVYKHIADETDNNAKFSCVATNAAGPSEHSDPTTYQVCNVFLCKQTELLKYFIFSKIK